MYDNIYIRRLNKDNNSLKLNLPVQLKKLGYNYKDYIKIKVESDESITISKLDLREE